MNISFFIANKIAFNQKKSFSSFIVKIAITAIALSTGVMITGTAITKGYQKIISEKFYDCWGNIHVTNFLRDITHILNDEKIKTDTNLIRRLSSIKEVESVHTYSIQSCLLKTNDDMEGILLKGIDNENAKLLSSTYLIEGKKLHFSNHAETEEIMISKSMADKHDLGVNDKVILYFLNKNEYLPRARKIIISGIYNTGLEDYDKHFALCDKKLINKINDDSSDVIQGYEIYLADKNKTEKIEQVINEEYIEAPLQTYTIEKRFSNIFSWLGMMKMNERIIIIIMLIIATINMITAFLILIMERVQMIGILKSLGMQNRTIGKIFLYTSFYIISTGIFFGLILGIGICFLQQQYGLVSLDENIYYIKKVPVYLHLPTISAIVAGTLLICLSLLLIPVLLIKKITPTKALKFN